MVFDSGYCQIATFVIGIAEICYMVAPVGDCGHCCLRNDAFDIQYKLYTRYNPDAFQLLPLNDFNAVGATYFDVSRPTVIYLMGFSESTEGVSTTLLRDIYLTAGDYNFIAVDWSRLIAFPWYITAVRNTYYMGNQLAQFIIFLQTLGVPATTVHIIGFSLGAEAAGFAGKYLKANNITLGRITGLDPAFPGYNFANNNGHLSKGDALFVDILHTNPGVLGFPQAIGDVDFYPNAGSFIQPGCWVDQLVKNREVRYFYGCSHVRAWRLFAESILNPTGFPATLCKDWKSGSSRCWFQTHGYMGFGARPPMSGKMYLETNDKPPFAKNGP